MTAEPIRFAAADVPMLRREQVEWLRQQGVGYYNAMIELGAQPIRPTAPRAECAELLAEQEMRRLSEADLWYFDQDLCELLAVAQQSMPRFAPVESDLPSRFGFVLFAQPIGLTHVGERTREMLTSLTGTAMADARDRLAKLPIEVIGATWGPSKWATVADAPAGAVWITFYARSRLDDVIDDPQLLRAARTYSTRLNIDNEAVVCWCPESGDPERFMLPAPATDASTTYGWAALIFAAFRLAGQVNLAEQSTERTPRPERKRTKHVELPERDVRIARLRPRGGSGNQQGAGSGREYHHRWVVRGHWRNQPWGAERKLRQPVWVLPHVKGPDGAPLLGGERVTVVSAPPEQRG